VAAPLARRHVARAAWANAGTTLPPLPNPARGRGVWPGGPCRLPQFRQGDVAGMPPPPLPAPPCHVDMPASPLAAGPTAADGGDRRRCNGNMPELGTAAGPCRHWPRRHVPRVAWPGVPPLSRGRQIFSEVVSFAISLVQVVSSVKNSRFKRFSNGGQ
jgi:hypothetical protein